MTKYLTVHYCSKTIGCGYSNRDKSKVNRHMQTCSAETHYSYKEVKYPNQDCTREELKKIGIVDDYRYVCWDIECVNNQDSFSFGASKCLGKQELISIALYGDGIRRVFLNEKGTCLEEFLGYLEEIQSTHFSQRPEKVKKYMKDLHVKLQIKNLLPSLKTKYHRHLNYLRNMTNLFVIGYNSGKYDLPAIIGQMLDIVDPKDVKVIKQGSSLYSLTYNNCTFIDAMKFNSGGSLDKFAATFGATVQKTIFPYEFFSKFSDISSCTAWPPMKAFKSSLSKPKICEAEIDEVKALFNSEKEFLDFFGVETVEEFCVSPRAYFDAKVEFEFNLFSGKWKSFVDYLVEYNLNDVKMLFEAFGNYCQLFNRTFDCQVLKRISLPGLAEGK